MRHIHVYTLPQPALQVEDAVAAAEKINYPVMIRSAFALGGLGSGICADEAMLREMVTRALSLSPQVLVEKSLKGWKEVRSGGADGLREALGRLY